jgi:hypothetical protein
MRSFVSVTAALCASLGQATSINILIKLRSLSTVCVLAVGLCAFSIAQAQSPSLDNVELDVSASDGRWTVLTMAPDGSWGAATESMSHRAIGNAIADCSFKHREKIGCGAYQVAVQRGWILGIRCGKENILAAARDLAEAEWSAVWRENELRRSYVLDMPACRRVVTIDPRGMITLPTETQISSK